MVKRVAILFLLPLILSACILAPSQPTPTPSTQALSDLFDKKWIFQYAVESGERTMEYLDEFNKRDWLKERTIWITITTQTPDNVYGCNRSDTNKSIPETAFCFMGYDGCNNMSGLVSLSENGAFQLYSMSATLSGCPMDITSTKENPDGTVNLEFQDVYSSDPFQQALTQSSAYEITNTELKLYYPSTHQNFLLFTLSTP